MKQKPISSNFQMYSRKASATEILTSYKYFNQSQNFSELTFVILTEMFLED